MAQQTAAEIVAAKVKAARVAKVPLVLVQTADPAETAAAVMAGANGAPVLSWDVVRGLYGRNEAGDKLAKSAGWGPQNTRQPVQLLMAIGGSDTNDRPVYVMANIQRFLVDVTVIQAVWNLRDWFKSNGAMLVMVAPLGQKGALPDELTRDVLVIEHALPDDERVRDIVRGMLANTKGAKFEATDELIANAAAALRGAAAFACEQLTALTIVEGGKERFDLDGLMGAAKRLISETQGLSFEQGRETFADVGGLSHVRRYAERLFAGPHRPAAVVRVEELEKSMAGSQGDLSGVSQDALRVWLQAMEENHWTGLLGAGPPGSGKSLLARSMANTFNAKPILFDVGACKGSLIGQSESRIRAAMQVLWAIAGPRAFFVASVNNLANVPPELQRRFTAGVWYFDTPSDEDRAEIWQKKLAQYGLESQRHLVTEFVDEADLTGADIRNICEAAVSLNCTVYDALQFVVPLKRQSPTIIAEARALAAGRFIDASRGGAYVPPNMRKKSGGKREIN